MKFLSTYFSSLCRSPCMAAICSRASTTFPRLLTVHSLPLSRALMKIFDSVDLWGNELVNMFGLGATDSHLTAHLSVHTSLVCLEEFWEASETLVTSRQTMSTLPCWLLMRLAFKNHRYQRPVAYTLPDLVCGRHQSLLALVSSLILTHKLSAGSLNTPGTALFSGPALAHEGQTPSLLVQPVLPGDPVSIHGSTVSGKVSGYVLQNLLFLLCAPHACASVHAPHRGSQACWFPRKGENFPHNGALSMLPYFSVCTCITHCIHCSLNAADCEARSKPL